MILLCQDMDGNRYCRISAFLIIYVSALLRGCYLIMFRIKNNELRGILTAIACGIFGMMISAYGNAFFGQFPTGFIIILFCQS